MITIYYVYTPKHGDGKPLEYEAEFTSWQKALRFMKKVDGPNFNGHVTGWSCDDPEDNEILWSKHRLCGRR